MDAPAGRRPPPRWTPPHKKKSFPPIPSDGRVRTHVPDRHARPPIPHLAPFSLHLRNSHQNAQPLFFSTPPTAASQNRRRKTPGSFAYSRSPVPCKINFLFFYHLPIPHTDHRSGAFRYRKTHPSRQNNNTTPSSHPQNQKGLPSHLFRFFFFLFFATDRTAYSALVVSADGLIAPPSAFPFAR